MTLGPDLDLVKTAHLRMGLQDLEMLLRPSIHGQVKILTAIIFLAWLAGLIIYVTR